ncbi:hypothetical protein MSP8886_01058 [Marinomonas spartinae]|uniref:Flagellar protein FliT n=1 Tax=Marinomonas spartinae TaxID=1792290 RepID=A0A1A8T8A5_9GAMM|nr:hypothetical protein [Marinomonas spartinae]SBS28107.1 hypothetical protein MSP8886_01058 [Marinomonas spartinae]
MLDTAYLVELTDELEASVQGQDVDSILQFCEQHDAFIRSIQPSNDAGVNQAIKEFAQVHQRALELVENLHTVMQNELFKSTKTRQGVIQYKGVKHAK